MGRHLDSRTAILFGLTLASFYFFAFSGIVALAQWTEPVKLDTSINGVGTDHFPFVTASGNRIYWSSNSFPEGFGSNEDIYFADWDSAAGAWGARQHIGSEVNTTAREWSACESPDGKYLWFIRYTAAASYDVFYSTRDTVTGLWNTAVNAGSQFNSNCTEWSVTISPDGLRMILLHGIRPNTIGCEAQVFWISYWNDSTQWWDSLVWMGDFVNSSASHKSATMSLDTNYIVIGSGANWPGVTKTGLVDLFKFTNNAPDWDSIASLGVPPNSTSFDITVALTADGTMLYFSSTRDLGGSDIYVTTNITSSLDDDMTLPGAFALNRIFPNPFNSSTKIEFSVQKTSFISITVHDILGRLVTTLMHERLPAGQHEINWNAEGHPSGIYFIRATDSKTVISKKVLFLK